MAEPATDRTYLSQFRFLQKIPYIEALEQSDDSSCFICTEPYNMGSREWVPGGVHDFPVRLPCRHVLGLQCLARWTLSSNFSNRCGLCRAKIIPEPDGEILLHDTMVVRLFISSRKGIARVVKEEALYAISVLLESSPNMGTSRIDKNRTMMLFEEFLSHFARQDGRGSLEGFQPPRVTQRHGAGAEQAVGQGPVAPRPRRTSVLKRILLSLGGLVLGTMLVLLCVHLCWWIQLVVDSRDGIDVVVNPTLLPTFGFMFLMIGGALGAVFDLLRAD